MKTANPSAYPLERFIPNPKAKLLDQVREVIRFKHYSIRTEPGIGVRSPLDMA